MSQGDIAVLGIKVESGEAAAAADDLDKLTKAGERAEAATGSVGAQAKSSGVSIKDLAASTQSAEQAMDRYTRQAQAAGMSTKAYTAALRGVPAQFTDIVVSLQGGQAPLQVLLQQGGQLKDMFGGIGPAAKALGGYVAGLVNPFTIAGAAVAGLGVAYYKGSEEAQDFRKALILTGNAAGTNAGAMSDLARQISTTVGTTGAAAEVLAQLASNGKIAGDSIGTVATAALQMKDATGRAVEETVAEFVKIGKDPVAAAKELNEQYNFLTASTYAQIVALKEQGDTVGAAKLLTDTYAQTIDTRSKEIVENLGWIEKAWRGVWGMTKSAGDAALSFGRSQGLSDQLAEAKDELARLEKSASGNSIVASGAQAKSDLEVAKSRVNALQSQLEAQQAIDQAQENYRQRQRDSILAQETLNGQLRTTDDNQKKLAARLKEINELAKKSAGGDGGRVYTETELNQLRDAAREQFKDKPGPKGPTYREDAGTKALDQARQQYSVLQQQNGLIGAQRGEMQKLGEAGQTLVKWEQQLADIKDKKVLTADQKSLLANQQQITDQLQKNAGLEKEMQLRKVATEEAQKLAAFQGNLNSQLQRASLGLDSNLASMGLGDVARQRMQERLSIEQQYQQQLDNLEQQHNEGRISKGLYEKESDALRKALDDRLAMQTKYYEDVDAAQADWSLGARSAFASYLEQARDVAGQTRTLFSNAFSSMEDAVANFAITGKLSFSDFAKSVLADMARIATRQAITGIAGSLFGSAIGGFFGGGASAVGEGTMTGFSEGSFVPNAKGGVYDSPSLSHFSNQVHSTPQFFAFAKGAGVFGEAGPEAIMPLTRAPDGNLGVRAVGGSGAGGSTSISVNAPVNISVPDRSGEGMELDQGLLQQNMQKQMEIAAQKAVAESWRPGGISHRNATRRT
ncbi:phage tail tape measure protein [Pseudomonas sp. CCOS 191]|uniref:phage tail tape measure protein n=1 Tax=Pseudomonas sp. CCOS 191 TaxID=1649877 RepID=UPI000624413E|nr:phage tail tape measure protein [Pseudomonas sp. CCOS 191]CRI56413.1 lambda family phage tail tape measure protein [Pseudomonas sp. CCOS 191]